MTFCKKRDAISTLMIVLIVVAVVAAVGGIVAFLWFWPWRNLKTEEVMFRDFTAVEVEMAFEVKITQSSSYSVIITADERIFDDVQVSKTDDTLKIGFKPGSDPRNLVRKAEITMPELYELVLSGATHGTVEGFSTSHTFVLSLSGASSLEMVDMSVGDIEIDLSGASTLNAKGAANDLLMVASGASNLELSDFTVHNANINLSGASHATINLDGRLDGDVSGGSHLKYVGNPTTVDVNTSGGSTVSKK